MNSLVFYRYSIIAAALLLTACSEGDDDISDISLIDPNANELRISFTDPEVPSASETFVFDASGDSAFANVIMLGQAAFDVDLTIRDISNPDNPIDMTAMINENAEDYQVFYELQNSADSVVTFIQYNDEDSDGRRLGLSTAWNITAATTGDESVRIFLVSGLDKQAVALDDNTYDESKGGVIELDAVFPLDIQ